MSWFLLGLFVGCVSALISRMAYQHTLILCAKGKSAEFIWGKAYYIVPSDEYLRMAAATRIADRELDEALKEEGGGN